MEKDRNLNEDILREEQSEDLDDHEQFDQKVAADNENFEKLFSPRNGDNSQTRIRPEKKEYQQSLNFEEKKALGGLKKRRNPNRSSRPSEPFWKEEHDRQPPIKRQISSEHLSMMNNSNHRLFNKQGTQMSHIEEIGDETQNIVDRPSIKKHRAGKKTKRPQKIKIEDRLSTQQPIELELRDSEVIEALSPIKKKLVDSCLQEKGIGDNSTSELNESEDWKQDNQIPMKEGCRKWIFMGVSTVLLVLILTLVSSESHRHVGSATGRWGALRPQELHCEP